MKVIKSYSKEWDIKKVYPKLEHPSDHDCRKNIPIIDKVFIKRLGDKIEVQLRQGSDNGVFLTSALHFRAYIDNQSGWALQCIPFPALK